MIKKILIGIVTAGMILITIPTVNAEDEITLNEVTDQIIDISDKYNSAGITSGQLLNLITLTQTDDELLDTFICKYPFTFEAFPETSSIDISEF